MKKLTAWILTVAVLTGLGIFPAAAQDRLTVSLGDGQVEAGGTVTLDLTLSGNTELSSLTVRVFYRADVLTCTQVDAMKAADGSASAWQAYVMDCVTNLGSVPNSAVNPNDTANLPADRAAAGWKMASLAYTPVPGHNYSGNGVLASLTFRAPEGLGACETPVEVQVLKATCASTKDVLETVGRGAAVSVQEALPEIREVTPAASAVTVTGGSAAAQTVQMSAFSAKGTDITSDVTWTVSPEEQGVTVNGDGLVSVEAKAQAGTYTVTASAKSGLTQGEAKTAEVTVTRSTAAPAQVTVSGTVDTILVPGLSQPTNTAVFTAAVTDQFGGAMTGQNIIWTVLDSSGQPVDGISVENGTVTVSEEARMAITDTAGKLLTVRAQLGSLSDSRTVAVRRAAQTVTGIEICRDGRPVSHGSITIPLSGSRTERYTVRVLDQYGQEMAADAAWSVVGTLPAGVTVENGAVTVTDAAAAGSFDLRVSAAGLSDQIRITVSSLAVTWDGVDITTLADPVYGTTNDDIVNPITADRLYYSADGSGSFDQYLVGSFAVVDGDAVQGAGPRRITVRFTAGSAAENGAYKGVSFQKELDVTIARAEMTLTGAVVADKVYNGRTDDAVITGVTFSGLVKGESLTAGTDYTVSGVYAGPDAGEATVTVTVTLKDTAAAGNYVLTGGTYQTTGAVSKTVTTLELSAKDAVYTGKNYAESNITKTSNVADAVAYTYYSDAACTQTAEPRNVGTYYVKGIIAATTNASSAEAVASFKITAAPLTVKAKDHSITYGEAPANGGVTYTGFVNGETERVVSGLTYTYSYTQYGNVGSYTITPKGAAAANYAITFQPGTLTVEKKPVTLTWTGAGERYYNGQARQVEASVNGLVNGDAVTAVVTGGTEKNAGSYTAAVTGLTGAKAGNYRLPATGLTAGYTIVAALTEVTVSPATLTAVIDGLTIRLAGTMREGETILLNGSACPSGSMTVHGVVYTIDAGAVEIMPAAPVPSILLTAEAGIGGTVEPASVYVAEGADQTFAIIPSPGYTILELRVDGRLVPSAGSYTFTNVTEAHTLSVLFFPVPGSSGPTVPDPGPTVPDPGPTVPDPGPTVPDPGPIVPGPADPPASNPFTDVTKDSYYYDAVLWAVEKGITYGVSTTQFGPEQDCTRGQMVTFLWRAAGMPKAANRVNPFTDVSERDYYYEAVLWAVEKGITYGVSETRFAPDESCTRSQMVTFLWRANGKDGAEGAVSFTDVKAGEYYAEAVAWAVENGITYGVSATRFAPEQDCTRGQMAAFLYRCEQAK